MKSDYKGEVVKIEAKRILVVEDDKYLTGAYVAKLTKIGFEVRTAADGEEALVVLDQFTPDLIILDLVMPKKDGFATLREIKDNGKWKHIPVIVATNLGQQEDIDRVMKLGAQDYIMKSDMTVDDFVRKVKMVLHVYS
jgi:DNA-binding response OmpR family regulator